MKTQLCAVVLGIALAGLPVNAERCYFIGNSLTDNIHYDGLTSMAQSRDIDHAYGRQMIPGAPLYWTVDNFNGGFRDPADWADALANYSWDVVTLQVSGSPEAEYPPLKKIVDHAAIKNPGIQAYVYATWPMKAGPYIPADLHNDYAKAWNAPASRYPIVKETFETVTLRAQSEMNYLEKKVLMIPVGHVLEELDKKIKAGQLSGVSSVFEFYGDDWHLNSKGSYVVGCTFFATIYKSDPLGLDTEHYAGVSPQLAEQIQRTVWSVVTQMSDFTGVNDAVSLSPTQKTGPAVSQHTRQSVISIGMANRVSGAATGLSLTAPGVFGMHNQGVLRLDGKRVPLIWAGTASTERQ